MAKWGIYIGINPIIKLHYVSTVEVDTWEEAMKIAQEEAKVLFEKNYQKYGLWHMNEVLQEAKEKYSQFGADFIDGYLQASFDICCECYTTYQVERFLF